MGYLRSSGKSQVSGLDQLPIAIGHDEIQKAMERVDYPAFIPVTLLTDDYRHTQETALGLSQVKAGV